MMRHQNKFTLSKLMAASTVFLLVFAGWLHLNAPVVWAKDSSGAVVKAVEGKAEIMGQDPAATRSLQTGMRVKALEPVHTDEKSKVLLRWDRGLLASMAEFSFVVPSTVGDTDSSPLNISLLDGLLRVASDAQTANGKPFYVTTPILLIQPQNPAEPVDFVVETYEPGSTSVTVISGNLAIKKLKGAHLKEEVVPACNTVYIKEDRSELDKLAMSVEDVTSLIDKTTILGTMPTNFACPTAPAGPSRAERQVQQAVKKGDSWPTGRYLRSIGTKQAHDADARVSSAEPDQNQGSYRSAPAAAAACLRNAEDGSGRTPTRSADAGQTQTHQTKRRGDAYSKDA
ncbi:MAG: hypothetical protein ACOYXY_07030 [Thermodesulfobacteriota bacterium]